MAVSILAWQEFNFNTSLNCLPQTGSAKNYSFYFSGVNAFVDREKLLELGGFNEDYSPFYIEDIDLSVRAWRMGWKGYFEPDAICRHQASASIRSKDKKRTSKPFITGTNYISMHFT